MKTLLLGLAVFCPRLISAGADELAGAARSPFALRDYFSQRRTLDVSPLWRELGIPAAVGEASFAGVYADGRKDVINRKTIVFDRCENDCEVMLVPVALNGEPGQQVLVRFARPRAEEFRYLLFQQFGSDGNWRLLGHVDYAFSRYFEPTYRVVTYGTQCWLVFRAQAMSGSGLYLATQEWYELRSGQLRIVLSLSSDGSQSFGSDYPYRDFSVKVIGRELRGQYECLLVRFTAEYDIEDDVGQSQGSPALGSRTAVAVYRRAAGGDPFEFSSLDSQISLEEINSVFSIVDSFDSRTFLKHDFANLHRIAADAHTVAHEWLAEYLTRCPETPEREQLLRLLSR